MSNSTAFHKDFANKIIEMLEQGTAPWQKPWEPAQYLAPHNPTTGKPYQGVNFVNLSLMAMEHGYEDPRWMTYKQAQDNGYQVKKGSKGTPILFYKFRPPKDRLDDEGNPVLKENGEPVKEYQRPIIQMSMVFNASQIDGLPPFERPVEKWKPQERAEAILKGSGAVIKNDQLNSAYYTISEDEIHLPPKSSFDVADKYYATALHELGHWTRHPNRLDRESGAYGSEQYAKEELRAEIASWMIGMETGVGHDPGQHAAYVQSWIKAIKDHPTELLRACNDAEKIKGYLMEFEQELVHEQELPEQQQEAVKQQPAQVATEKTWLNVSYEDREQAKALGARWDNAERSWYAPKGTDLAPLGKFIAEPETAQKLEQPTRTAAEKTMLHVPYVERNKAKALGARWDNAERSWYAPQGTDLAPLAKYLEPPLQKEPVQQTLSVQEQFAKQLADMGLDLKGQAPIMDGKVHRVPLIGKTKGLDGAYCLYDDGIPAGWVQNFSAGLKQNLTAQGVVLSAAERAAQEKDREARQARIEQERQIKANSVADTCQKLFAERAQAKHSHEYLTAKGVPAVPGIKASADGEHILVPMFNDQAEIRSLQAIDKSGQKTFMAGGEKKGCFFTVNSDGDGRLPEKTDEILLAEGYATGASLHMATGKPVAVAFDAGNLEPVAKAIRDKFPQARITICADNDHKRQNNVGVEKAEKAAKAVGGVVKVPTFTKDERDKGLTDFNDLHQSRGLGAIQKQLGVSKAKGMER